MQYTNVTQQDEYMCELILEHVDGKSITPKIPVYNRLYRKLHSRNQQIILSAKMLSSKIKALEAFNQLTVHMDNHVINTDATTTGNPLEIIDEGESIQLVADDRNTNDTAIERNNDSERKRQKIAGEYANSYFPASKHAKLMPATMPEPLPPVAIANFRPVYGPTFVGNISMSSLLPYGVRVDFNSSKSSCRGGDKDRRKKRECKICYSSNCRMAKTRLKRGEKRFCALVVAMLCDDLTTCSNDFKQSFLDGTDSRVILLECIRQCLTMNFKGMGG
jgi:hypothetical protein